MREGLICFRHAVRILLLFVSTSFFFRSCEYFCGQSLGHGFLVSFSSETDQPLHSQALLSRITNGLWNLECCTTHTSAAHFYSWSDIFKTSLENLQTIFFTSLLDPVHGFVENVKCNALLSVQHQVVHEARYKNAVESGIRQNQMLFGYSPSHDRLTLGFRPLCSIFRTTLCTPLNTCCVQRTTYNVITYSWQVFHTTSTNQHNAVFLQVMAFTTNVCIDFIAICQTNTSYFTHSRVRFLWRCRVDAHTNAAALWARVQGGRFARLGLRDAPFSDELLDGWHSTYLSDYVCTITISPN